MAITNFVPEVWSAEILLNFKDRSTLTNTVNRQYEGDARRGNQVHITSVATPTIADYAAGTTEHGPRSIVPQELSATGQTLLIDQEKAFAFYVDDVDARQVAGSMNPVIDDAGSALRMDAETYLAAVMAGQGTTVDSAAIATGDEAFGVVMDLRTQLSTADVPAEDRWLAVNPEFASLLLGADSKLTNVDMSGSPAGLRDATIGRLLGFNVIESNHIGAGSGLPTAVAYHTSAAAFVGQLDSVEALRAQYKFADIVRGLYVYGARVTRPEAVRVFQAAAA